ncbi:TetR/AcrR family transcriptional regulator [Rhodococcus sp. NCIMB 12038]|uniref:TetR/AcrR family transcriptional regulator n=1 Tax=Rhodococcus sp. NCIMB 12038 TaxID=933800 RepID=UPI0015C68137|nr:TetR/AcrR family transcriptional regulator [Rhodococcus sp. NCIMB 12038]
MATDCARESTMLRIDAADAVPATAGADPAHSSPRLQSADELREYLAKADWTDMGYRRRQILEAFVELACAYGYASVSMRNIGEKVGVKAPSIYRHFEHGRDEIVTEAFRWHFYRFASAVLDEVDATDNVDDFWNAMIRVHLRRQLESPENNLWDILMASDRIAGFLPSETRAEYYQWLGLYERMYEAAAIELGYKFDDVAKFVKVVVKVLDTASEWCRWDGTARGLNHCVDQATAISRALLGVDLDPA